VPTCEALGLSAGGETLKVDDLVIAEGDHLEALLPPTIRTQPVSRSDDRVLSDLSELGRDLDSVLAPLLNLEPQDLTGLVGAASGRGELPPQMAVRYPSPLRLFCEERR
jgi:hypothetical protein